VPWRRVEAAGCGAVAAGLRVPGVGRRGRPGAAAGAPRAGLGLTFQDAGDPSR